MTRQELNAKIPHGYKQVIAAKAGVTKESVSKFLNGHTSSLKIEMAALEVLSEIEQRKRVLINQII